MGYLIAVVVVVGVLCVLNLLLTYGVIRRLREHTELLSQQRPAVSSWDIIGAGSRVGSFAAATIEGEMLSEGDLAAGTLVGFFSPGCGACDEVLPKFVEVAAAYPGGRDRVLAVVTTVSEADSKEQVAALSPNAQVVVVQPGNDVDKAFEVKALPGFALVGAGGVVEASGSVLETVAAAAKAVA